MKKKYFFILIGILSAICPSFISCDEGEVGDYCIVDAFISSISIHSDRNNTLTIGEHMQLSLVILPDNASNNPISFSSSNQGVATVSSLGEVIAVGEGSVTITATAADGSREKGTYQLIVEKPIVQVSSIEITGLKSTMTIGEKQILSFIVLPDDATNKSVTWSSSNQSVATVSSLGEVIAVGEGPVTITATAVDGSGVEGTFELSVPFHMGYEYVDLGLPSGILWATMNVGAKAPEDYGDYYAWGDTDEWRYYDWINYKWCHGSYNTIIKYCTSSNDGSVDNKTVLDPEDDAAHVKWGGDWRMPTREEQNELLNTRYCTWTWTTQKGVAGYKVTSKINENFIFLPAAGSFYNTEILDAGSYGYYWSSSLHTSYSSCAYYLFFHSDIDGCYDRGRFNGQSVRAVCKWPQ